MIANTFIRRPNTAIVISLIIVILGIVSISKPARGPVS